MSIRFGSVCSGIEAASVAWEPLGWEPAWFSEIAPFPKEVLAHHYPTVPDLGDMTKLYDDEIFKHERIDLLVGGTPCQSFSLQGVREGLADPRGVLALEFLRLADIKKPRWIVWENVPNVLRVNAGRAFGTILGALVQLGYGFSYRVLDAQFFGVPQIRRRVYIVGHLGDWRPAAAVLFESGCLSRSLEPSRGQEVQGEAQFASACGAGESGESIISFNHQEGRNFAEREGVSNPLILSQTQAVLVPGQEPRRFTPEECEKLMGFTPGYTAIGTKTATDSARYKVLGDSMAVPVMRWIGERIATVDRLCREEGACSLTTSGS
jgi:DNA (cytosine-5)-methyltransferase 1